MGLFRKRGPRPDPAPPLGVILHYRGRAIPCDALRDEGQDWHGRAAWVAVPCEPVVFRPGDRPGTDYSVTATVLPDDCDLIADFARPADDAEEWPLPDVG